MNLRLENVSLSAGAFRFAADVTVSGAITGVFGPSGAGKTTLLEIIAGLRRAAGRVVFRGRVLADDRRGVHVPAERRAIGYVPQDLALFPHLSVRQNLLYGFKPAAADSDGITLAQVVELFNLSGLLERRVTMLSGGEQQRIAFARALLASPRLLILDEPLTGLDRALKLKIIPYLKRIPPAFRVPLLYVSHSAEEIMALCDEVLLLRGGRLVAQGAPADFFHPAAAPQYELNPDIKNL